MISTEEATQRMFDFINKNISCIDGVPYQEGNDFHVYKSGIEFILMTTNDVIWGADKFIEKIKKNGKENIPTAVLGIRSTSDYDGKLLKRSGYAVKTDLEDTYYRPEFSLTKFEQKLVDLYATIPYYNPSLDCIQVVRFIRTRKLSPLIQKLANSDNPKERQIFHIHEGERESTRKISIEETIKGPFTLEAYERKKKPIVARIVPYQI